MLADTVGPGMRVLDRRAEPGTDVGRRRRELRPARQPLLARRARVRARHPRRSTRSTRCGSTGVGMTNLVRRATAGAKELHRDEYVDGRRAGSSDSCAGCSPGACASSA